MGLEQVLHTIQEQATQQVAEITGRGKKEAASIERTAAHERDLLREEGQRALKQEVERHMETEQSAHRMLLQKKLLQERKHLMDGILQEARREIRSMSSADKKKIYRKLYHAASREITPYYVYTNARDKSLVSQISKKLHPKGTIELLGGVIFEDREQNVRVNYSFDRILQQLMEEEGHALYRKIF